MVKIMGLWLSGVGSIGVTKVLGDGVKAMDGAVAGGV
jgi:hypothetical protein